MCREPYRCHSERLCPEYLATACESEESLLPEHETLRGDAPQRTLAEGLAQGDTESVICFCTKYIQTSHAALEPMAESTAAGASLQRRKKSNVAAMSAFIFSKSSQCVTSLRK